MFPTKGIIVTDGEVTAVTHEEIEAALIWQPPAASIQIGFVVFAIPLILALVCATFRR